MRRVVFSWLAVFLACVSTGWAKIPVQSIVSDWKQKEKLIDGDKNTSLMFPKGKSSLIFNFGKTRYVKSVKIYFREATVMQEITVNVSDDLIQWKNVLKKNNVNGKEAEFDFKNLSTLFVQLELSLNRDTEITEIEFEENRAPQNKIYGIRVSDVGEDSAKVRWKTSVKSTDYFYYRKKMNGQNQMIVDVNQKTDHEAVVKNLLKGTTYACQVVSESVDGSRLESETVEFTTKGIPLPEIWVLKAENITPYTAKLFYQSNIPTAYEVRFGRSEKELASVLKSDGYEDKRSFELLGLQPEETYYYQLYIRDKTGNVQKTPPLAFATPAHNIALGKKAWGTFVTDHSLQPSTNDFNKRIVDGDLNYFTGMAVSLNADHSDQYVCLDLGEDVPIRRLDVYWWGLSYSRDYRIDLSYNGTDWETTAKGLDGQKGQEMRSPTGNLLVKQQIPLAKHARFVRLYVPAKSKRGSWDKRWQPEKQLYLCEIAVIKEPVK